MTKRTEVATLAGGCFWCLEAVFELLRGVEKVESGYSGGHVLEERVEFSEKLQIAKTSGTKEG